MAAVGEPGDAVAEGLVEELPVGVVDEDVVPGMDHADGLVLAEGLRDGAQAGFGGELVELLGLLSVLLVPTGFLAYLWINKTVSGNPLQFLTYQSDHWNQRLGWFFATASYQTRYLIDSIGEGNAENVFGLWIPNLVWHFGTLALFAGTAKKLRPSYAAWLIAYFAIAIGTTWLLSGPRYLLSMPAVAVMLALTTEKRWQQWLAAGILVPLSVLYLLAFVWRWQVW